VPHPEVRADLELVAVGCWGNVVHIVDPALGSDLLTDAMTQEVRRQRERHPQARIVGSLEMDYGNSYCEDVVDLPSGENAYAGGWDCDDERDLLGDPEEVLRAIGVGRGAAADAGFDLDEEPTERVWSISDPSPSGGPTTAQSQARRFRSSASVERKCPSSTWRRCGSGASATRCRPPWTSAGPARSTGPPPEAHSWP
jgi:hypothetical protein